MDFDKILSQAFDLLEEQMENKQLANVQKMRQEKDLAEEEEWTKRMGQNKQLRLQELINQGQIDKQQLSNLGQIDKQQLSNLGMNQKQELTNKGLLDSYGLQGKSANENQRLKNLGLLDQTRMKEQGETNRLSQTQQFLSDQPNWKEQNTYDIVGNRTGSQFIDLNKKPDPKNYGGSLDNDDDYMKMIMNPERYASNAKKVRTVSGDSSGGNTQTTGVPFLTGFMPSIQEAIAGPKRATPAPQYSGGRATMVQRILEDTPITANTDFYQRQKQRRRRLNTY